jgi:hypothetical protein
MYHATRITNGPIITQDMHPSLGDNINGPSLIRVPDWVSNPLGKYYLYFAHHGGKHIRMAYADEITGPWQIHVPGVLQLEQTVCRNHIASPDVHLDSVNKRIVMYFHGPYADFQHSFVATSDDGLNFTPQSTNLGPFYFRVFEHEGFHYALAKIRQDGTQLLRSRDGFEAFTPGPFMLPSSRHTAVLKRENQLDIFFSRGLDCPERIFVCTMSLQGDWQNWQPGDPMDVLKPELDYEGVNEPLIPSSFGAIHGPAHQLRDPAIYTENDRIFMLYSCAGESSLAIAELTRQ